MDKVKLEDLENAKPLQSPTYTCFDCIHCVDYMVCNAFKGKPNIHPKYHNYLTCGKLTLKKEKESE